MSSYNLAFRHGMKIKSRTTRSNGKKSGGVDDGGRGHADVVSFYVGKALVTSGHYV